MWVFTTNSFVSVVKYEAGRDAYSLPLPQGAQANDLLLIRARASSDLTAMLEALELSGSRAIGTAGADYPHRAVLTRSEWARYLALEAERIDYTNFKSRVRSVQGRARHDAYLKVWSILRGLSTDP